MAEYVRWRLTRARAGVTMALFGLLAALGLRAAGDQGNGIVALDRTSALATKVRANSIGSAQVKMHSLLLSDIKLHQVASFAKVTSLSKKVNSLQQSFIKMNDELKILEAGAELKADADATFLKKADTAANSVKLDGLGADQLVQGHGQVLTGQLNGGTDVAPVVAIPGILTVNGDVPPASGKSEFHLLNTSSSTLLVNDGATTTSVAPGNELPAVQLGDGSVKTLQVVFGSGGTQAVTLTLSSFLNGNLHTLVGQALVGTP